MNIKKMMLKIATAVVIFSFMACDHDPETIGSDIIGGAGFNADLYDIAKIGASTQNLAPVQTNNLPVNLLGVYEDDVFGIQTASILTQLSLSTTNPSFGTDPQLDSVVLHIPYFHSLVETIDSDSKVYELDSIYGSSPIKLSIFRSNLFLNPFDPESDFVNREKYFSNMQPEIEDNILGDALFETSNFVPSDSEVIVFGENEEGEMDTLSLTPRLRVKLSTEFFQNNIIEKQGDPELSSNNNFQNFLRGLYFKAEAVNGDGNMMVFNLREGGITLYYTSEAVDENDSDDDGNSTETIRIPGTYDLNLGQAIVNTFEQEVPEVGAESLFLKGGEGSMAIIELFNGVDSDGNGTSDELELLRDNDWLINEANLVFYINQNFNTGNEPEHLYLYDLENDRMLADYVFERQGVMNLPSSVVNNNHLVPLERDEDGNGIKYKIRLTRHIDNILNKDSTNVKLGLVVSQNVNILTNSAVLDTNNPEVDKIPTSSVISPEATVIYGPEADDDEKKLKLRIYYTEPKI